MRNLLIGLVTVIVLGGCSSSPATAPPTPASGSRPPAAASASLASSPAGSVVVVTPTNPPAPEETTVRGLVDRSADRFGWVQAPAQRILATYFVPGQRYLGGVLVAPTDQIDVIKMHGKFDHSAQAGAKSTASLALFFYDVTTGQSIPFVQMWDGDAPDLGVGTDPGIADRALAAKRWDLRLMGTTYVRTP